MGTKNQPNWEQAQEDFNRLEKRLVDEDNAGSDPQNDPWASKCIEDVIDFIANGCIIQGFRKAIQEKDIDAIRSYKDTFLEFAKDYGSTWYDDELDCYRGGYEWETRVMVALLNITERLLGEDLSKFSSFYREGEL